MSLKTARTRQRIFVVATLGTRLTRPQFRLGFEADAVSLTDARETVDELLERPEVVRLLVHPTDQCVSSTSVNSPTYTVTTPLLYSRSTRSRTSAFCAWARRFVRYRYSRRIHFEE
ncbi:MAG: hypothetical protein J07HQW1_03369 [Haloquadratum walsbyi J07HQW1]|uniref:Uncharacterized protein n=1 Tax=Haloquadratum walsbyi J07HQW1 TaxID=1238424 RepID=U1N9R7_9EURY|nr:MAG: hypothetical protein J07HQW1_03369 [Haloquadratum walsbyi J07HQW1]